MQQTAPTLRNSAVCEVKYSYCRVVSASPTNYITQRFNCLARGWLDEHGHHCCCLVFANHPIFTASLITAAALTTYRARYPSLLHPIITPMIGQGTDTRSGDLCGSNRPLDRPQVEDVFSFSESSHSLSSASNIMTDPDCDTAPATDNQNEWVCIMVCEIS
jgi:hypothetical protein